MEKDQTDPRLFWDLCLVKVQASAEERIPESKILLSDLPEYTKYLTMVDNSRRLQCIKLSEKQQRLNKEKEIEQLWKTCQSKARFEDKQSKMVFEADTQQLLINLPEYKQILTLADNPGYYERAAKDQIELLKQKRTALIIENERVSKEWKAYLCLSGVFPAAAVMMWILCLNMGGEDGLETNLPYMLFMGAIFVGLTIFSVRGFVKGKDNRLELNRALENLDKTLATDPTQKKNLWQ